MFRLLKKLFSPSRTEQRYTAPPPQSEVIPFRPANNPMAHPPTSPTHLPSTRGQQEVLKGRCWVIDGDTIVINKIHIRLAGIDAPEMDQPFGKVAKSALVRLCKGQVVTAHTDGSFSHERTVAVCMLEDGRDLSAEMVPAVASSVQPSRKVTALGEVRPISDQVTVAAPTGQDAGRIAEIKVTEGARVKRGDVLAVMDTEPVLRAALDQAIADEDAHEVALAARSADLDATGAQLEAQVQELTIALERAQLDLDRMTRLRDSGLYEDSALVDTRLDVEAARFNLQNTELQLQRNRLRLAGGVRIDEARAKAELASAKAARKRAEADYAKARILAPMDGRVLAIFGKLGEQIGADGFALMGDTQRMVVRAEVYESDIGGVSVGQKAKVTSRALSGTLTGTVTRTGVRIAEQSILSTDPAAIVDARVIEVWITLDAASSSATADLTGLQVLVTLVLISTEK